MRWAFIIETCLTAVAAALLAGCTGATPTSSAAPTPAASRQPVIGVLVAGWHSGLILPAGELGTLAPLLPRGPNVRYVAFGWGNRRFYLAPRPTVVEAITALVSSPSVVLVQTAPTPGDLLPAGAKLRWLCADQVQVRALDTYLRQTLRSPRGEASMLHVGPEVGSAFYASGDRYDALRTCNTWTAKALHNAGLQVRSRGVIFASQVRRLIRPLPACPAPDSH